MSVNLSKYTWSMTRSKATVALILACCWDGPAKAMTWNEIREDLTSPYEQTFRRAMDSLKNSLSDDQIEEIREQFTQNLLKDIPYLIVAIPDIRGEQKASSRFGEILSLLPEPGLIRNDFWKRLASVLDPRSSVPYTLSDALIPSRIVQVLNKLGRRDMEPHFWNQVSVIFNALVSRRTQADEMPFYAQLSQLHLFTGQIEALLGLKGANVPSDFRDVLKEGINRLLNSQLDQLGFDHWVGKMAASEILSPSQIARVGLGLHLMNEFRYRIPWGQELSAIQSRLKHVLQAWEYADTHSPAEFSNSFRDEPDGDTLHSRMKDLFANYRGSSPEGQKELLSFWMNPRRYSEFFEKALPNKPRPNHAMALVRRNNPQTEYPPHPTPEIYQRLIDLLNTHEISLKAKTLLLNALAQHYAPFDALRFSGFPVFPWTLYETVTQAYRVLSQKPKPSKEEQNFKLAMENYLFGGRPKTRAKRHTPSELQARWEFGEAMYFVLGENHPRPESWMKGFIEQKPEAALNVIQQAFELIGHRAGAQNLNNTEIQLLVATAELLHYLDDFKKPQTFWGRLFPSTVQRRWRPLVPSFSQEDLRKAIVSFKAKMKALHLFDRFESTIQEYLGDPKTASRLKTWISKGQQVPSLLPMGCQPPTRPRFQ
jgi:hypothetical protein